MGLIFRHKPKQPRMIYYRPPLTSHYPENKAVHYTAFIKASNSTAAIGTTEEGFPLLVDIAKQPHIIIGGATGSGKSAIMQDIILSLLTENTPQSAGLVFIDPKIVEFSPYARHPMNYYDKIITDAATAENALNQILNVIKSRYSNMAPQGLREWQGRKIYIFIDELADIIIERPTTYKPLLRIAQIGRAAGVHLIIATQQPSAKILPTALKANCPCRIACRCKTVSDSRIILDRKGAESLKNPGDCIIDYSNGETVKGHADYYTDEEIDRISQDYEKRYL